MGAHGKRCKLINVILSHNPELPFSAAKLEQRGSGFNKRRDLTVLDKSGRPVLTGEVKLPYAKDGGTPYNSTVVEDARSKARRAEVKYFFTWNVNGCVLWETEPKAGAPRGHDYQSWKVTSVHREGHMEMPMTESAITRWLPAFLHDVARILHGTVAIGHLKSDEKFIERLESALKLPILNTLDELDARYKSRARDPNGICGCAATCCAPLQKTPKAFERIWKPPPNPPAIRSSRSWRSTRRCSNALVAKWGTSQSGRISPPAKICACI
jgi:hypothetical protein